MKRQTFALILLIPGLAAWSLLPALPPPGLLNYQGVLRDGAGKPVNGTFDILFNFYDHATDANNQILTDFQTVTISQGLLNVHLGAGTVTDGYGRGTYLLLSEVFRDYEEVWLQLQIAPAGGMLETLSPRVRIVSSAYALRAGRADSAATAQIASVADAAVTAQSALSAATAQDAAALGGRDPSQFLDTGPFTQYKAGNLGLGTGVPASHKLTISSANEDALRLVGPGAFGSQARLNFGDADYVYIEEDVDDNLTLFGAQRTAILGGPVGINTITPGFPLEVGGKIKSTSGGFVFPDGTEQASAAAGAGSRRTQLQIAANRWGELGLRNQPMISDTNSKFNDSAFDGSSLWIAGKNELTGRGSVRKVRPGDGQILATFEDAQSTEFLTLEADGQYVWAVGFGTTALHRFDPATGAITRYQVGFLPAGLLSDGLAIWATDNNGGVVRKTRASDGLFQGTFAAGADPRAMAFDGSAIWIVSFDGHLTKLRASDGATLGFFTVGSGAIDVVYDGSTIWVACASANLVTRIRASDGTNLGSIPFANEPTHLLFDGYHVWVYTLQDRTLTKLRASNGTVVGAFPLGSIFPGALTFDGVSLWLPDTVRLWKF